MKKIGLVLMVVLALIFIGYFLGPRVQFEPINKDTVNPISLADVEKNIAQREALVSDIKAGNEAQLVWADSTKSKTAISIVYIHGFSASHEEGMPIHRNFAKRYGLNLYLSRLEDHGRVDTNAFEHLTPQDFIESTEHAIEIGKAIGDKVILILCSTGSTSALYLAAGDPDIVGLINYSPNIDIYGEMDALLVGPWGKQMAKIAMGGNYNRINYSEEQAKYWNKVYHINGILALKTMINHAMTKETFSKITQPVFMAYYYKNEEEQDKVVDVSRMLDFYSQISTADNKKRKIAFENGRHVMSSHIIPSEVTETLEKETYKFAEEILGLKPVNNNLE